MDETSVVARGYLTMVENSEEEAGIQQTDRLKEDGRFIAFGGNDLCALVPAEVGVSQHPSNVSTGRGHSPITLASDHFSP